MANHRPSTDREPPSVDPAAAQQLAAALRRGRLTLLCGAPGAGKSALLAGGLLPLLRRRNSDATMSVTRRPSPAVLPFPERRSRDDRAALAEFVISIDAWDSPSVAKLHDGIDAALRAARVDPEWYREPLAERVQSLASRFGTRFLFVLDGFEAALQAGETDPTCAELMNELARLLDTPLAANLLIVLRADAEPLLAPLLDRLRSTRAEVLMLEEGRMRRVYGAAVAPPPAPPVPVPRRTELFQFDHARMPEAANTGAPTRPGGLGPPLRAPASRVENDRLLQQLDALLPLVKPRRPATRRLAVFASVALLAIVGGVVLFRAALPSGEYPALEAASTPTVAAASAVTPQPAPTAPRATLPTPALALPPRPSLPLRVDADSAGTRLPRELAQALAADGGADVRVVPAGLATPSRSAGPPGLAIVRYDVLQAAARADAKTDLAVIAPLYTEELQIAVRADSPLRFIHQIEGRRIDIGATQSARGLTAQSLYRQMFGRPLPPARRSQLDAPVALRELLAGQGPDAVVLIGPQPAAALAALPPVQRRRIKLLELAPDHPASRRALQTYLPATLRDPAGATTPTLAAMSFLVTTGRPDADTARVLGRLAGSLCSQLPALQRDGDAKWRALRAGQELDTGLPPAGAAGSAWRACAGTGLSSASPQVSPPPSTPARQ